MANTMENTTSLMMDMASMVARERSDSILARKMKNESVSVMFRLIRLGFLTFNDVYMQRGNMRSLNVAILVATMAWAGTAGSEDDEFTHTVNYVFSGNIEGRTPQLLSGVIDQNECIISVETPGHSWAYYMKEIKLDSVVIDEQNGKISFAGDNTIVEHTFEGFPKIDKDNKASITLRGDVQRVKDALKLIFTKYCLPKSG